MQTDFHHGLLDTWYNDLRARVLHASAPLCWNREKPPHTVESLLKATENYEVSRSHGSDVTRSTCPPSSSRATDGIARVNVSA
jgi:hypothetical protein